MAVTFTTAAERDARRITHARFALPRFELPLLAVSALALALLAAAYGGAVTVPRATPAHPDAVVNLNTVADATTLERVLEPVFPMAEDRRFAARELFAFLVKADGGRRTLPNVGAIARIRVPDRSITTPAAGPGSRPLLTSTELAQVKPSLVVRDRAAVRTSLLLWGFLYLIAFHALSVLWCVRGLRGDRLLLTAAHLLTALGFAAMVSRPDPLRDGLLFVRYAQGVIAGIGVAALTSFVDLRTSSIRALSYVPLITAFMLSLLLLSPLGDGPVGSGAKVNLGPFQPIEAIRILLALFLAGYFARNWELLRAVRSERIGTLHLPSWVNVPRARFAVPVFVGVFAALALFFGQHDLGPALMLAIVFLAAYAVARGTVGVMLAGAACLAAGFYLGYRLDISSTLVDRVRIWQAPWNNTAHGGEQISQALWSLSTGAMFGTGIGLGDTRYLPAGHTDLVLAAIGEELGYVGLLLVSVVYATIIARIFAIARRASTDYGFFLATLLGLFIAVPVLLMASGTLGIVPLTGVVTPFLSFGGSAMVANFAALGLLASVRSDVAPPIDLSSLHAPLRWLGGGLVTAALLLVAIAGATVVRHADDVIARPHLGLQADGMRRFQYNPRLLDLVRRIPHGSIVDRNGLVMATDDVELARKGAAAYAKVGIPTDASCAGQDSRCYPLGGRA